MQKSTLDDVGDDAVGSINPGAKDASSPQQNMSQVATRGALIVLGGRAARILCQFASLVVTARYLSPTDFGLAAMAGAIVGVASMLGDFGLSLSALRFPSLPPSERNSLFWISTALGAVLAIVVAISGPALSAFYNEPRITLIVLWLCPLFIINGASAQYRVYMMQTNKYIAAAVIDTGSAVFSLLIGVMAALGGAGYWTLISQNLSFSAISLLLVMLACGWLPMTGLRIKEIKSHFNFGWSSTATQICNYFSSNISSVALGKFLGPIAVGTFSRAFQLFSLPVDQLTSPLTALMLPLLGKVPLERVPFVLIRIQRCLVYTILGVCLFVAVGGSPLVTIILGSKWAGIDIILQTLMIGAVFQISGYIYYWAFLRTGKVKVMFWCEVPSRLVMAGLVAYGAWYGEMGAAIGHSVGLAVCWIVAGTIGMRALSWPIRPLLFGSALPVALYGWAFFVGNSVRILADGFVVPPIVSLIITLGATALAICCGLIFPIYRQHARELIELGLSVRKKSLPTSFQEV
jgi:PST family polysaccharide transporter